MNAARRFADSELETLKRLAYSIPLMLETGIDGTGRVLTDANVSYLTKTLSDINDELTERSILTAK